MNQVDDKSAPQVAATNQPGKGLFKAMAISFGLMLATVILYVLYIMAGVSYATRTHTAGAEYAILVLTLLLLPLWVITAIVNVTLAVRYLRSARPQGVRRAFAVSVTGLSALVVIAALYLISTFYI